MKLKTKLKLILRSIKITIKFFLKIFAFSSFALSITLFFDSVLLSKVIEEWKVYDKKVQFNKEDVDYFIRYTINNNSKLKTYSITEELYSLINENDMIFVKRSQLFKIPYKFILNKFDQLLYSKSDWRSYLAIFTFALFLWFPLLAFSKYFEVDIDYETISIVSFEAVSIAAWVYLICLHI